MCIHVHLKLQTGDIASREPIPLCNHTCIFVHTFIHVYVDRQKPPPLGGFSIYYVPSSRTVCKRTPLEEPGTNPLRGVLLHTVLDEGT